MIFTYVNLDNADIGKNFFNFNAYRQGIVFSLILDPDSHRDLRGEFC
jgi:hypothetical protein